MRSHLLPRTELQIAVRHALRRSRAVVLNGPRQSGKSTIAQGFLARDSPNDFDLENPLHEARLAQPVDTLSRLEGLMVIDEVQRRPNLFPLLRVLIDRSDVPGRFCCSAALRPHCSARPESRFWAGSKP